MRTKLVQRFAQNIVGRDFVVGDIHGCFSRLRQELERIHFDPEYDRLFSVGDLVDRGPESHEAIQWVGYPWFHPVLGNHEDMAIRWPEGNMDPGNYASNGGSWNIGLTRTENLDVAAALSTLPLLIEVETALGKVGIVHADCPTPTWSGLVEMMELYGSLEPGKREPLPKGMGRVTLADACMWSRERISGDGRWGDVPDVRAVIVGHTPVQRFTSLGNVLYIDTGAVFQGRGSAGGFFTILDLQTMRPV